jgi:hypothetical protein
MTLDTIETRGFSPRATAIAARTVGACYQQCCWPDTRAMIGLAIFSVTPSGDNFDFAVETSALRDDQLPGTLLDWLEQRLPEEGAILSWDHWWSLAARLRALATDNHPRIRATAADTEGRWRDMPRSITWHLKHARANAVPCLCIKGDPDCTRALPSVFLPDPAVTERTLAEEAMRGWVTWARLHGDFDDAAHPAHRALAAYRGWVAADPHGA